MRFLLTLIFTVAAFGQTGGWVVPGTVKVPPSQPCLGSDAQGKIIGSSCSGTGTGVSSFNTRVGAVVPASADYTAAQVTNAASTAAANTFGAFTQTFGGPLKSTSGATTGAGVDLNVFTDMASNTGTGYVFTAGTATGSAANPFQILCKGVQCASMNGASSQLTVGDPSGFITLGMFASGSFGAIYFNQATPSNDNYGFLGNSTDSFFNAPTGTMHFRVANGSDILTLNSTALFSVDVGIHGLSYAWPAAHATGVLTNDGAGNLSWTPASGGGVTTGTLAARPSTCAVGALYFATDQPAGQQLDQCSALNTWTVNMDVGPSTALAVTSGKIDIVTSVVPLLASANPFTGLPSFAVGQDMIEQASGTTPAAGKLHIYANTDNTFHQVTPAGVDTALGGSSTELVGANGLPAAKGGTPASAVNWVGLNGSATGDATSIIPDGSDANITMVLSYKGAGAFQLGNVNTSTSNAIQLIDHAAGFAGIYLDIADPLSVRVAGGTGATVLQVDPSTHITTIEAPKISVVAVASLPACGGSTEGLLYAVNDAAATPVYNATVAGGGSVHIPVYCNGTNWVNH